MQLPDRMYGVWNAADIADTVSELGDIPLSIFHDSEKNLFPQDVLVRCFGRLAMQMHTLILTDDDGNEVLTKVTYVNEIADAITLRSAGRIAATGAYFLSTQYPPRIAQPHGDVRYVLEK